MAFLNVLHLNGPDTSDVITDEVTSPFWDFDSAFSKFGQQTTSISKFGAGCWGGSPAFVTADNYETMPAVWTTHGWFRLNTITGDNGLIGFIAFGGGITGGVLKQSLSNAIGWNVSINGTSQATSEITGTKNNYVIDQWYHIALTYDSGDGKYYGYIDGVKDFEFTGSAMSGGGNTWAPSFAGDGADLINDGYFDELIITDATEYPGGTTFTPPTGETNPPVPVTAQLDESLPLKQFAAVAGVLGDAAAQLTLPMKGLVGVTSPVLGGDTTLNIVLPKKTTNIVAGVHNSGSAELELPLLTLDANDGIGIRLSLPAITLDASGITGALGSAILRLPLIVFDAEIDAPIQYGGVAVLPLLNVFGQAIGGNLSSASLTLPRRILTTAAQTGTAGVIDIVLPSLTLEGAGYPSVEITASLELPMLQLVASGFHAEAGVYRIWALNMRKGALTEYTNFDFNSFTEFSGVTIAAGPNGIHVLDASDDDNTVDIASSVRFGNLAYGTSYNKRIPRAYIGYRSDGYGKFTTITQGQGAREYMLPFNDNIEIQQRRIPIGKGPKSTYWQFGYDNIDGADFAINSLILRPDVLRRRVF